LVKIPRIFNFFTELLSPFIISGSYSIDQVIYVI
jgi:hypothetical protein